MITSPWARLIAKRIVAALCSFVFTQHLFLISLYLSFFFVYIVSCLLYFTAFLLHFHFLLWNRDDWFMLSSCMWFYVWVTFFPPPPNFSLYVNNKAHQILGLWGISPKFFAGLDQLCQANRKGNFRRSCNMFRRWSRPKRYCVCDWHGTGDKKTVLGCVLILLFSLQKKLYEEYLRQSVSEQDMDL